MQPILNRILVEPIQTKATLIMQIENERATTGKVIACGDGRKSANGKRIPMLVKPGDVVAFNANAGQAVPPHNFLCMTEDDILAIIE